ncbi:MAG TPA: hypothetical protein VED01_08775 [Burkholderiales bacterium]|nr:hypothetical protein [Burkholderiales bacterium]
MRIAEPIGESRATNDREHTEAYEHQTSPEILVTADFHDLPPSAFYIMV